ncbi:RHS repeat-associated core domain-containing protein [Tissierella sp.]|uniref:RHS repeat domain-containing protein n=1 Tax=Tissierella sp. TaxID=41274 RepID=UPI0030D96E49
MTDHLGSVRTTAAAISGKVVQQLEYTPGGTIWRSFDQNALQPKHFCGKEQLTVHGYNMYDSGKRFHTSNGIRFISIDPLAEKYYSWSPYVYCFDNPMRIIDPDGQDGWDVVAGYGIGLVTNIIPGSGALRDAYAPNDASDYNDALQGIDNASVLVGEGMIKTGGTGMAVGTGAVIIGTTATVGSGGTLAIGGLPVAGAGAVLIEAGAVTAGTGVVLMANGKKNQDAGYNRGKKNEAKSINQLNNDITKKKAPMGLKRFDKSHGKGGQEHVHFDNNSALNKDGSWKEGDYKLSNKIIDYLKENGWKINK